MKIRSINVGLQQKVGQPNFGSTGASCVVEVTLDDHEADDVVVIEQRIRQAFARCRRSIEEELQKQHADTTDTRTSPISTEGSSNPRVGRPATEKQLRAIQTIASKQGINILQELESRFRLPSLDMLSVGQASTLIDSLKSKLLAS
ncbi:hypothetical protein N9N28_15740 [Rubripirellula amarantea]|nr:hypothetical protein [Rubripirellula amarantea]